MRGLVSRLKVIISDQWTWGRDHGIAKLSILPTTGFLPFM